MDNTDKITSIFYMDLFKTALMVVLTIAVVWFGKRLNASATRQDRILTFAEGYAKMGEDRRTDAKEVITQVLNEKTDEIKKEVPVATAQIVKQDVLDSHPDPYGLLAKKKLEEIEKQKSQQ